MCTKQKPTGVASAKGVAESTCLSRHLREHRETPKRRRADWSHAEALLEHLRRLALEAEVAAPADIGDLFTVDGRTAL